MTSRDRTTIYQVATEAGVAISTVSKVLSNKPGVSEETRLKVQQAISRLGYVPSMAARGLSGGQTGNIGLIFAFPPHRLFNDPFLSQNLIGISEALNENNNNLILSTAKELDPASSYERIFRSRYFDGVIIMETPEVHILGLHKIVREHSIPWVIMGYPEGIRSCFAVYADDYAGGQMAAEHLLSLGHRQIALINSTVHPSGVDRRVNGFRELLLKNNVRIDRNSTFYGDFTENSGYQMAKSVLDRPDPPSAIFSVNDRMALGIMRWAGHNGLTIPGSFSIIGFDDIDASAQSIPPLTTIRQPGRQVGQEAALLLLRLINGDKPPSQIVLGTELIQRNTTGEYSDCREPKSYQKG